MIIFPLLNFRSPFKFFLNIDMAWPYTPAPEQGSVKPRLGSHLNLTLDIIRGTYPLP